MLDGELFGVREICDVVFKARTDVKIGSKTFKKGQPVLYIDSAKTSTMEGAATTVYAQGGKGNPRLIAWEGERTVTFTVEDALISPLSFAMLSGAGVTNASQDNRINVHTTFDLPILEGGIVKIDYDTAGDNHDIYITEDIPAFGMILDDGGAGVIPCTVTNIEGPEENCGVYTITRDKELVLTFGEADKYVGHTLRVDCYTQKTDGAVELTIDANKFAGSYYVEASTLWRDKRNGVDHPAEIVLPNVKIQSNFTFSMAASGDPSTFTFTMDSMPAYTAFDKTHKVFAAIQIIGEDSIQPDVADEDEESGCKPLPIELTAVTAGAADWTDKQFAGDPKNVQFTALGNNLKATIDRANVDFSGNLRRIENWTAFSDKPADLTGYYFPFTMEAEDGAKFIRKTLGSGEKTLTFGQTGDGEGKINMVMAIDPKLPVITAYLESADGSKKVEYSFDFSRVKFQ